MGFQGHFLSRLSINFVAMNKHMEKLPPPGGGGGTAIYGLYRYVPL